MTRCFVRSEKYRGKTPKYEHFITCINNPRWYNNRNICKRDENSSELVPAWNNARDFFAAYFLSVMRHSCVNIGF